MASVLHGSARTTPCVSVTWPSSKRSQESTNRSLATRYGPGTRSDQEGGAAATRQLVPRRWAAHEPESVPKSHDQ